MFIRKFLEPQKVDEVHASGQFIKVMNSEGEFRIRATNNNGGLILDTEARAGFDVQVSKPFDKLTITSSTEQKLELWVSQHKLSYDALSTKASRAGSFLVEHFGQSQQITTYDPSQSKLKIMSSLNFWVGGDGVDLENGIPVKAGEVYTHESAAPLSAFIDTPVARLLSINGANTQQTSHEGDTFNVSVVGRGLLYLRSSVVGLLNVETGVFNKFESIPNQRGGLNFEPILLDGKLLAVVGSSNGVVDIVEIDEQGFWLGAPVSYSLGDAFNPTTWTTDGESLYLTGSASSGFDRVKIYKITGLNVVSYNVNINDQSTKLVINNISFHNGSFYMNSLSSLYVSEGLFNDCVQIASNNVSIIGGQVLESAGYKIFTQSGKPPIVIDESNVPHTLPATVRAAYFDGVSEYRVDDTGVKYSNDGGVVFQQGFEFELGMQRATTTPLYQYGEYVYMLAVKDGFVHLIAFDSVIDKSKPKAKFRVFKESF